MGRLRRIRWHLQRLCTIRLFCTIVACCVLVKITKGYSINRIDNPDFPKNPETHNLELKGDVNSLHEKANRLQENSIFKLEKSPFYDNLIVHFDLKGAAPKVNYLFEVFELIKRNGATGILIEWEDTFPWSGNLADNRATDAYSLDDVHRILSKAHELGLDVIPLVQTFGHLEWILKIEKFRKHREHDAYPQVVCLADEDGVNLVKEALKQVIEVHKPYGIKYFHIGADEAFQYGTCQKDMDWFRRNPQKGRESLAAFHLKNIAEYVRSLIPSTKVLAWYDMLKTFLPDDLSQTDLPNLIEPVVWDYSETLQQQNEFVNHFGETPELTWRQLAQSFQTVWGSSAYKGANYPAAQEIDLQHYMKNNLEWLQHKKSFGKYFNKFRGLFLAGWSRYDHFAVLAELLVSAVPSLVLNLQVAQAGLGSDTETILKKTQFALGCNHQITAEHPSLLSDCQFPGVEVFNIIHREIPSLEYRFNTEIYSNHEVRGWLGRMNIRHNYTQLWYFENIRMLVKSFAQNVAETEDKLRNAMKKIYSDNTIDEWMYEYFDPLVEKVRRYTDALDQLSKVRVFPRRNFGILRQTKPTETV